MIKKPVAIMCALLVSCPFLFSCGGKTVEDSDKIGLKPPSFEKELSISVGMIANITLDDTLYDYISDKFNVNIEYSMLDYNSWNEQVSGMINGGDMLDVVQWDMRPYLATSYQDWIAGEILKPIPTELKYFPNLDAALKNINALKYMKGNDDKLYCIPLQHGVDTSENGLLISDMHYIYRRDWAKAAGLYKEGDVYTFSEMEELLRAFAKRGGTVKPFADVNWGLGSLANYWINQTGSYLYDNATGKYIWKLSDENYIKGLDYVKGLREQELYNIDFYTDTESDLFNDYSGNRIGIYYNNFTLKNLDNMRESMHSSNSSMNEEQIRDATATFYLVDDEGKIANEGMENWWSCMLFNNTLSNEKMERILAIMDWMLSDEGLYTCAYGIKDTDWKYETDGSVTLLWEKDGYGNYIEKDLDCQNLRWLVSTCGDMVALDPTIIQSTKDDYNEYRTKMRELNTQGKIHYVTINREVEWLSTASKNSYAGMFRTGALTSITKYINGDAKAITNYYNTNKRNIEKVLNEINKALAE